MQSQDKSKFAFQQVDVFASQPLRGNPLAVVVGADTLAASQMAALANWTNLSETTFLLPEDGQRGLSHSHLYARARVAFCGPSHIGELPRMAGFGREAERQRDRPGMRCRPYPHSAWP
jgi:PhzF family phenazine biosynthesis protein